MKPEWIFRRDDLHATLGKLGFSAEFSESVEKLAGELAADAGGREQFLGIAHQYLDDGKCPDNAPAESHWRTLLALTGYPRMVEEHRTIGIPEAVTQATARDLQRWAEGGGATGRAPALIPLGWVLKPIRSRLLEIGRLQFLPASFCYPFRIFVHRADPSRVVALAEAGLLCSRDGWPVAEAADFETTLQDENGAVKGHVVDPRWGFVESQMTTLRDEDWKVTLKKGDGVLDVHIPSGGALRESDCLAAFHDAEQIFWKSFPEFSWKAFVCTSWLLDREFSRFLGPTSGIVAFGSLFQPLPAGCSGFKQMVERVFDGREDWQTMPTETSLQRVIVTHFQSGGAFRTTSGFRLRERAFLGGV